MLTKKDLLLEDIKIPEEEEKVEMALPPDLGTSAKSEKKSNRFFSPALFMESLRSNKVGLSIVSLGNAIIIVVIIIIMSTLNINSTSEALSDLFGNADTESTVKSGAISMYSSFTNSADAYITFDESQDTLENTTKTAIEKVEDTTLQSEITVAKTAYDVAYRTASGTEDQKNATAKSYTMSLVTTILDNDSSMTEDEKSVAKTALSYYFDIYATNKSATTKDILIQVLPLTFGDVISTQQNLDNDTKEEVVTIYQNAFNRVYTDSEDVSTVSFETSLDMMKVVATGDTKEFVAETVDSLIEAYESDKEGYLVDPTIQANILSSAIQDYVFEMVEEFAYYEYLPAFTVTVVTSDRGYPVRYVETGEYSENGNAIMKEVEVTVYNPDVYTEVKGDMGAKSNMLEKMHKDVITGEGYTDEEIEAAKKEASENLGTVKDALTSFMSEFIVFDENGKNAYYDGTSVDKSAIKAKVSSIVSAMAEQQIIDKYNEKNTPKVSSLKEITKQNYSMSGEEMIATLSSYIDSGIASYESYMTSCKEKGYSDSDALLVATVKGSTGVINSLPGKVSDALTDMGDMNTYGIMVGFIGFGIASLLIPMVYTIMLADNLLSSKVETGSLAFTLSTPTRRISFVFTEGVYLLFSELVMGAVLVLAAILTQLIGVASGGTDLLTSLPIKDLCLYAVGNIMVSIAISGICFLASCYFNKSNQAIASGGGLNVFFYICSILGLFGTKAMPGTMRIETMNYFNYLTINALYDPLSVMNGDYWTYGIKLVALAAIAIVTYALGMVKFTKKDLPL